MENRNLAIGLTLAAALLCGLPGLMSLGVSALVVIDGPFPDQPQYEWITGIILLCSGLLFIAIPVFVGILTLRRRTKKLRKYSTKEPIPPPN